MIKLMLFAPCERVIVSQEDSSVSLISLLTGFTANLPFPTDQPIPEHSAVPMRWYLLSMWGCEGVNVGTQFYQRVALVAPSGRELIAAELTFGIQDPTHQVVRGVTHFGAFPVVEFGKHYARLFFREDPSKEWFQLAEYPIEVTRGPVIDIAKINDPAVSGG